MGRGDSKETGSGLTPAHKRSMSFPEKRGPEEDYSENLVGASHLSKLGLGHVKECVKTKKKQVCSSEIQNSLRKEILELEKRLQDQVIVRRALENALGYSGSSHHIPSEASVPMPATQLIKEISILELEVGHLEQYLLSLYRKAFDQPDFSSPSKKEEKSVSPSTNPNKRCSETAQSDLTTRSRNSPGQVSNVAVGDPLNEYCSLKEEKVVDSGVQRCHSSLSQRSVLSRISPPECVLSKGGRSCHSQPLSMLEFAQNSSNVTSLAEHLGTRIPDLALESPHKLSEEMVKCMSSIYCKLADPPMMNQGFSSPNSSFSSFGAFSPRDQRDMWSSEFSKDSSFDVRSDNPFVEGLKELSGPYSSMIEISCLYRDEKKLSDIEEMLQTFSVVEYNFTPQYHEKISNPCLVLLTKSTGQNDPEKSTAKNLEKQRELIIRRLEDVDPKNMKHEEKLAFWINVHNALVMHAYLAYGTPRNNVKRVFLLLKAAYNVGGHVLSADTIQNSILGCRMSRPGQWLRMLLPSRTKFKTGDERQAYAIEHPEPLLHFALCSGSLSDPAVRVYTPKRVIQELELAKDEYVRANFGIRKDHKIILPKVVESFCKDSGLCPSGVIEIIQLCVPESVKKDIKKCQARNPRKSIEWSPYSFAFRYLISQELIK